VPVHVCIVGGDGVEHRLDKWDSDHEENCQHGNTSHTEQDPSFPGGFSGIRRGLRSFRFPDGCRIRIRRRLRSRLIALLGHVVPPVPSGTVAGMWLIAPAAVENKNARS
jgi:hypothetical protein